MNCSLFANFVKKSVKNEKNVYWDLQNFERYYQKYDKVTMPS